MRRSIAATAEAMHGNPVAAPLSARTTRSKSIALGCAPEATGGNQSGSAMLAFIDECFIVLKWKHEYAVIVINTHAGRQVVDTPRFSRAMRGVDGKVFDVRWLDHLMRDREFHDVYYDLHAKKSGLSREDVTEMLLRSCENHMAFIRARVVGTAVSE